MKLNSAQLEAFFTVAKLLHFTRAAAHLNVTQSALSQRIAKLEDDLETTLFIRDRGSIRLTEPGERVLRFCQINDLAESELFEKLKDSKDDFAGVLRVGGFSSVNRSLIIPAMKKIMFENPRLSIHLVTKELHELEKLLKSSEADYIVTNRKSTTFDIKSVFLGFEENVLVKSTKYPDTEIFLDHDERDATTNSYFSKSNSNLKSSMKRYLDDVYGLIDGVKCGYGKAILPLHLIEGEREIEILEPKRVLTVPVYIQYFEQPYFRRVHSFFLSEIQEYFKKKLRQEK
jgi:DNA-binding transcriptional LysR family regulator